MSKRITKAMREAQETFTFDAPAPVLDQATAKAPAPVYPDWTEPGKAKDKAIQAQAAAGAGSTFEERIKARAARMGIDPKKIIVATVSASPVKKATTPAPVKAETVKETATAPAPVKAEKTPATVKAKKTPAAKKAAKAPAAPAVPDRVPLAVTSYKKHLKEWADMTDRNCHLDLRREIIKWAITEADVEKDELREMLEDTDWMEQVRDVEKNCDLYGELFLMLDMELADRLTRLFGPETCKAIRATM